MNSLTDGQKNAFQKLIDGENVFLSGEAGTGKSYVLNEFLDYCTQKQKKVLAMAPTGIAALNIKGGATIHRSLKIVPKFCDPNEPLPKPKKLLIEAEIIIIDEISMVRIDLFERVAKMIIDAEEITCSKQVVFVGDFFSAEASKEPTLLSEAKVVG